MESDGVKMLLLSPECLLCFLMMQGETRIRSYGEQGVSYERVTLAPCRVLWVSCITGRKKLVNSRSD